MNDRLRFQHPVSHLLRFRRLTARFVLAVCVLSLVPAFAQVLTQTSSRVKGPIDASVRHAFQGSIPAETRGLADAGRVSPSLAMKDMFLMLQGNSDRASVLAELMDNQHNPSSPDYHHWLKPSEFGALFGVTDTEVETVSTWLQANGFSVEAVSRGKNWIRFSGTAEQVEHAFGTEMHQFGPSAQSHYANASEVSIPDALTPVVAGVVSLNSFVKPGQHTKVGSVVRGQNGRMQRLASPTSNTPVANPQLTTTGTVEQNYIAPGDFSRIYNTFPLVNAGTDGTGTSIAIVGRSDINLSDVEAFRKVFGLPFNDPVMVYANTDPGNLQGGDEEEAALDVEWSGAVAPKASIRYVIGGSTNATDGVDISSAYIVDNVVAPIMSVSYGACEASMSASDLQFYNSLWQQAAAEGITVFVSSGDSGSDACAAVSSYTSKTVMAVSGLSSTPYNVSVGGTEFLDTNTDTYWSVTPNADLSSAKGYMPEAVWNEGCNTSMPFGLGNCYFSALYSDFGAGGGGPSNCATHLSTTLNALSRLYPCGVGYSKPSWQTGRGVPADGVRDTPDVSLAAASIHDGFLLCFEGSCQWSTNPDGSYSLINASVIGGTSASSPAMAGIMALVEQKNGQFQGQANYQFYKLFNQQSSSLNCDSSAATDPTQSNGCVFHDITAGTNAEVCTTPNYGDCTVIVPGYAYSFFSGYAATGGYDRATGLGSVNALNLVNAWGNNQLSATTTALKVSPTTFAHGSTAVMTVTVAAASGVPTGAVSLIPSGTGITAQSLTGGQLNAGTYTASLKTLMGGTYSLTADYGGDASDSPSTSAPIQLTVTPEPVIVSTSILGYSNFYILGQAGLIVVKTVKLGSAFFLQMSLSNTSGYGVPTGTVTLTSGTQSIGTYSLTAGAFTITCGPATPCDFPIGTYNFTASYSGDNSFLPTIFSFPTFTITKGQANYHLLVNTQTPAAGSVVYASVTANADPITPATGLVTITRDDTGAVIGSGNFGANSVATIPFVAAAGNYNVLATWAGDANYNPGFLTSYPEIITTGIGAAVSTTTMTGAVPNPTIGQKTLLSINVQPATTVAGAPAPTGTIKLYTPNQVLSTAVGLIGGHVSIFYEWDSAGVLPIYATYSGDTNYAGSSSALVTTTVAKATPTMSLQPRLSYVAIGAQSSVTSLLNAPVVSTTEYPATGTVQFYDSLNGATAQPMGQPQKIANGNNGIILATVAPVLPAGVHTITAIYSGDVNWNGATAPATTITVATPDFSLAATPTPLFVTAGQSSTLTLTSQSILGYSAAISIVCSTPLPAGMACSTAQLQPGSGGTLTISTIAPGTIKASLQPSDGLFYVPGGISLAALVLLLLPNRQRRKFSMLCCMMVLVLGISLSGCSSNSGGTTPAQATSLALTSSNTKVASGSTVVLAATVNGSRNPTGTVTFFEGTTALGAATSITNGVATLSLTSLSVGTHALTATYSGDSNNLQSTSSNILDQTITGQFSLTLVATSGSVSHSVIVPAVLQ